MTFNAPVNTETCTLNLPDKVKDESTEYREKEKKVTWTIDKFQGESEHILRVVYGLNAPASTFIKKEIGPLMYYLYYYIVYHFQFLV